MPRTDNYQWTITSGLTFQHGTFLCGEPWVVDNGDLTLTAVTPEETVSELEPLLGTSGPINCTVLNPDTGKVLPHQTYYQNENYDPSWLNYAIKRGDKPVQGQFVYCVDGISAGAVAGDDIRDIASTVLGGMGGVMIHHDYRGGLFWAKQQQTSGTQFFPGNTLDLPAPLEAGDMVMTSYGVTGSIHVLVSGRAQPFTESLGVLTVLASAPGASAFRPPINWDPTDKANRPIYYEVDDLSLDRNGNSTLWSLPNYNFSSDTKTYTDQQLGRKSVDYCLRRCGTVEYLPYGHVDQSRGTVRNQANSGEEYGSYPAMVESSMFSYMFDPTVDAATRDTFRRVLTQRGIDVHGAVHSLGKKMDQSGGFNDSYPSKQMLAWAVTEDSAMYTHLDGYGWGAGGSGTHWPQKQWPNEECYGDYSMLYQDRGQMSFKDNSCSARHFDLEVIDVGTADNLHYVHVKRPRNRLDYTGVSAGATYGLPPLWLSNDSNASPSNWGATDNRGAVANEDQRFMSGYVRIKGQSGGQPYSAITRVVDEIYYYDGLTVGSVNGVSDAEMRAAGVTGATGHWDKNPTDGIWYLQHEVIPDDGGITGADYSNSLQETRGLHPVSHITFGLANSGGPSSPNAYGYVVCTNLLGKWKMCDIKGGQTSDNVPYLLKREAKKAIWMASTNEGKDYLFRNASTYNDKRGIEVEGSAWAALMRQGPGGGASLPPSAYQSLNGWGVPGAPAPGSTAEAFWPLPSTTTWEEINYDLSKIKIFARYRPTNGSYGWHRYQDFTGTGGGSAGTTYAEAPSQMNKTNSNIVGADGHAEILIGANNFEHKYFDAEALGWKAWIWPPGLTFPLKLKLKSSNASGPTDNKWEDVYELETHMVTENVIVGQEGPYPSVFFAEEPSTVRSFDAQSWRSVPFRNEASYDRAAAAGATLSTPGGEGEQFFNWMFRSTHNDNRIYGVHDCAVPWVTEDNGDTWKKLKSRYLYGRQEQSMLESPDDENVLWITMSDYDNTKDYGRRLKGIYKSEDRGENFMLLRRQSNIPINQVNGESRTNEDVLVYDPTLHNGDRVYYWATDGDTSSDFYRSYGGDDWEPVQNGSLDDLGYTWDYGGTTGDVHIDHVWHYQTVVHPTNHKVFLATDAGLFVSDNAHSANAGSVTFSPVGNGSSSSLPHWITSVVTDPNDADVMYCCSQAPDVGGFTGYGDGNIYKSTDGGVNWSVHISRSLLGLASNDRSFSPYSIFLSPVDSDTAWVVSGPDTNQSYRNFFFTDFSSPNFSTSVTSRHMINLDESSNPDVWRKTLTGARTQIVPYPSVARKNEAIIQGMGIICKTNNGADAYYHQDWFKGENWSRLVFDPSDDGLMYAASEDTQISKSVSGETDFRGPTEIRWWEQVPQNSNIHTGWYTTKEVFIDGDRLYASRGYSIGKRKIMRLNDRTDPNDQFEIPPGGVDYKNLNTDTTGTGSSYIGPNNTKEEDFTDSADNKFVPHNFDTFVKHPVTGRIAVGDNISTHADGVTFEAIPSLRQVGIGDGRAISAEILGMAIDQSNDDVYLWAVNGGDGNVRNQLLRALWDGTETITWDLIEKSIDASNRDSYKFVDTSYAIAVHPKDPNILWARVAPSGTASRLDGHLYRYDHTASSGSRWTELGYIKDSAESYSASGISSGITNDNGLIYDDPDVQKNVVGSIIYDPNGGASFPNGVLYCTPMYAAGRQIYRSFNLGDTWEHMDYQLPCLSNTKLDFNPITGELIRGGCDGTYVHPPPVGYERQNNYRSLWSRSWDLLDDPTYGP